MTTPWLENHISEVTDALMSRMNREACGGIYRRFTMVYVPSGPGYRGGVAVIPIDDDHSDGWLPAGTGTNRLWPGDLSNATSMTRQQIRTLISEIARHLPILDPLEN